jgi:hypothetical protein
VVGRPLIALAAAAALAGCSLLDAASTGPGDRADAGALPGIDGAPGGCALEDDFEDGIPADIWDPYEDTGATLVEENGDVRVSFSGSSEAWAGYRMVPVIDLTRGEVRVEVSAVGGVYTGFDVCVDDMELGFYVEDGTTLIGEVCGTDANDDSDEVAYDPGMHRIWRIRSQDDVVYWEASPNGDGWELIHSQPAPFPLDQVAVFVEAGGALGDPSARFESFSARPTDCAQ